MLVVKEVQVGSPAESSLQPGDILVRINGELVTTFDPLAEVLDESVGKRVSVEVERGGAIINMGSVAGLRGWPSSPIYSASKGGVVMLSRSLAAAYAKEKVRVWAICPGAVETPILERYFIESDDPEEARRTYMENEPMGRVITTDEVASLAVYLASDERFAFTPEAFVI